MELNHSSCARNNFGLNRRGLTGGSGMELREKWNWMVKKMVTDSKTKGIGEVGRIKCQKKTTKGRNRRLQAMLTDRGRGGRLKKWGGGGRGVGLVHDQSQGKVQ